MKAEPADKPQYVVLISGNGSNLQSLIDAQLDADIAAVISNEPDAYGLTRAENADIPTQVVDHRRYESRAAFDAALERAINEYQPELVVLAGFMRILTDHFVERFRGRLINIHPSLLPLYPGLNTHQRAIDAGDSEHGCTIHFVIPQLDAGPAIIQTTVKIEKDDTAEALAKRVQKTEHEAYPIAVKWFLSGRVQLKGDKALLDGENMPLRGLNMKYENKSMES